MRECERRARCEGTVDKREGVRHSRLKLRHAALGKIARTADGSSWYMLCSDSSRSNLTWETCGRVSGG